VGAEARPLQGFLWHSRRECHRVLRLWTQTTLAPVVSSLLFIVVFGLSLGFRIKQVEGVDYEQFIVPGLIAMAMAQAAYSNNASTIYQGRLPITIDDVLASPMIADPLHRLEIVMPCMGGAGVIVTSADVARRTRNRPVWIKGFGEHIAFKTPTYAEDLLRSPVSKAADRAFDMAGLRRSDMDMASIYDCYTITVLMSIEDAGFCEKGKGMEFVASHDLTYAGDFPLNTAGGQLSFGQAGMAGGMHHVVDGARQIMGRAGEAQVRDCNTAFVTGNGGIMSEQVALILGGD